MQILVDADSCRREARQLILRSSARLGIKAIFAANRLIPGIPPSSPPIETGTEKEPAAQMELCPPGEGAADNRIVDLAKPGDLVLTRDLPLAERLVDAGVTVLDDRGRVFTKENIKEQRSLRDFAVGLANSGLGMERIATYNRKDQKKLADSLDRELSRLVGRSK